MPGASPRRVSSGSAAGLVALLAACSSLPTLGPERTAMPPHVRHVADAGDIEDAVRAAPDRARMRAAVERESALTAEPLIESNSVTPLKDGPQTLDTMFRDMRSALEFINIETYILADDEVGGRLADIIGERARAGVRVRLIYDGIGSGDTDPAFFRGLEEAGVRLLEFHPPEDARFWRLNHRDHRKIVVVDGRVAFVGGMNFHQPYEVGSDTRPGRERGVEHGWRDTQARVEGPAAARLNELFLETWAEQGGETGTDPADIAAPRRAANDLVRIVASKGDERDNDVYQSYVSAIEHASARVWVTQSYFVPDGQLLRALADAAARGVDVKIIVPAFTDIDLMLYASQAHYEALLEAGIEIHEHDIALLHAKTAVIDGIWATVGSTNMDIRSFAYNDEVNVIVLGEHFGAAMERLFLEDLENSEEVRLERWRERGLWQRLKERVALMFKPWI